MTANDASAVEVDAERLRKIAEADCGCRIPYPFDEVADHLASLAEAEGFKRGLLAHQPTPASDDREALVERLRRILYRYDPMCGDEDCGRTARAAFDEISALLASTPKPATSEDGHWIAIEDRDASVPLLVGCWVETDDQPPRWSSWTAYPGEPLGCDGTWGDPPTHCQPLPPPAPLAALAGKDVEP